MHTTKRERCTEEGMPLLYVGNISITVHSIVQKSILIEH